MASSTRRKFQAANEACREHLDGVISEDGPQLTPEQEDAMLAFAGCMREHGIDVPDPGQGGFIGAGPAAAGDDGPGVATGPDPNDPEFQEAFEACRQHLADVMPGRGDDGEGGAQGPTLEVRP